MTGWLAMASWNTPPHFQSTNGGKSFEKIADDPDPVRQQIIGVVGNARYNNLREPEGPSIYTPLHDIAGATLNIRTGSSAAFVIPWLRKEIETAALAEPKIQQHLAGKTIKKFVVIPKKLVNIVIT